MRANTSDLNQNDERLKEYQRQQERLKAMTTNSEKIKMMSADVMIENLLKQSFVKPKVDKKTNSISGLPIWLHAESDEVPGSYKNLWTLVKSATNFADTQKVSHLLLTSGLQTEVLGHIWNIANKIVPGQLDKQEFYIVLALVGLAQSGYTFNNLSVLSAISTAPIPSLQIKVLDQGGRPSSSTYEKQCTHLESNEDKIKLKVKDADSLLNNITPSVAYPTVKETANDIPEKKSFKKPLKQNSSRELFENDICKDFPKASNFPYIGSSPTAELEDEDDFSEFHSVSINETNSNTNVEGSTTLNQSDEFTDFQCATIDPLEIAVISQKKEIPKIPLPRNLGGKLRTNLLKISPESEKKLKVLTQSETLSSLPESKISTNNKVSMMPNISVLGGSRDIGMRLANHSLHSIVSGSKGDKTKQQRHNRHKQQIQGDDLFFQTKFGTMDELFPKCFQKSSGASKTFILKETKIGSVESSETDSSSSKCDSESITEPFSSRKNTRKIQIPMLGTFNETTLPTQNDGVIHMSSPTVELFSVEEDKYSALREVELEMKMKNNKCEQTGISTNEMDDFGEFLSADIQPPTSVEESDIWGEWNVAMSQTTNSRSPSESEKISGDNNSLKNTLDISGIMDFDLLTLNEDDGRARDIVPNCEVVVSDHSLCNINEDLLSSTTEPVQLKTTDKNNEGYHNFCTLDNEKKDMPSLFPSKNNILSPDETDLKDSDDNFSMFFQSDFNRIANEINKEDSLPSLDLKVSTRDGNEQENVRKKCLVVCLKLMQEGVEAFEAITTTSVLEEIFSTQEAINYLNCLKIVSHISRRISTNCGQFSYIQDDIDRFWKTLINYCSEYNVPLLEDVDSSASVGRQCHVCLGFVGNDSIDQGFNSYHPSCANFWINCIDSELPCSI